MRGHLSSLRSIFRAMDECRLAYPYPTLEKQRGLLSFSRDPNLLYIRHEYRDGLSHIIRPSASTLQHDIQSYTVQSLPTNLRPSLNSTPPLKLFPTRPIHHPHRSNEIPVRHPLHPPPPFQNINQLLVPPSSSPPSSPPPSQKTAAKDTDANATTAKQNPTIAVHPGAGKEMWET